LGQKGNGFASDSLRSLLSVLPSQASLGQKGRRLKHSGYYGDKRLTRAVGEFAFANRVAPC